ncbi:formamidopyrimidine-DNA glycosylase [Klebsormidium nitens]|uniref:Formamidopyrimidine-DNA glycosylase n=1 Tax=Klebsormidium nitens TaxID=105231 RepID=A0A1Y1HSS9_KLENI|nr:formamidopyrimidine-DNA glycosylase [Klebsormidium nitens]|eukprot:GAQ81163.1 formamidopyrimidine-DNA glycosylase [Klebsormidium nitens]
MPELPEVEAARKLAHEHCAGKKIIKVVCEDDETVIQDVKPAELARELEGRTVKAVQRKGKSLWFEMADDGPWPSFHFGMTGSFAVQGVESVKYKSIGASDPEQWPPRFHKVVISFEGGVELAFCDARRFARVRYLDDVTLQSPIADLGFDALTELPAPGPFHTALTKRRAAVKAVLLDQGFLAGIGNWVADEVLYHARVHPESLAAELDEEASGRLRESIKMVLETAVAANAVSDKYPSDWLFHHRWDVRGSKKEAPSINGHAVAFLKVGGRTSAYLPDLQKRVGGSGAAKPKRKSKAKAAKDADSDEDEEVEEPTPAESSKAGGRRGGAGRGKKRGGAEEDAAGVAEEEVTKAEEKPKAGGRAKGRAAKKEEAVAEVEEPAPETAEGGVEMGEIEGGEMEGMEAQGGRKRKGKAEAVVEKEAAPVKRGKKEKVEEAAASVAEEAPAETGRKKPGAREEPVEKEAPAKRGRARKGAAGAGKADEGAGVELKGTVEDEEKGTAGKEEAVEKEETAEEKETVGEETVGTEETVAKEKKAEEKEGPSEPAVEVEAPAEEPGPNEETKEAVGNGKGKDEEPGTGQAAVESTKETEGQAGEKNGRDEKEKVAGAKRGRGQKARGGAGEVREAAPTRKSSRRK